MSGKNTWKKKIIAAAKSVRTYQDSFLPIVETLAEVLEQRDKTHEELIASGGASVVEHTNQGGATNLVKNPYLIMWDDLNKTALTYWRELGLTPAGLKKLNADVVKEEKKSGLEEALLKLGGS